MLEKERTGRSGAYSIFEYGSVMGGRRKKERETNIFGGPLDIKEFTLVSFRFFVFFSPAD